jgi:hypothetical protein
MTNIFLRNFFIFISVERAERRLPIVNEFLGEYIPMRSRWLLAVMLLFALAVAPVLSPIIPVQAQDDDGTEEDPEVLVTITGMVEVLEDDLIVIDGVEIAPAGAFIPAELEVGDYVEVTGYLLSDDTLQAVELIKLEDVDEDGVPDEEDNCPEVANPEQEDTDEDGIGDACDPDLIDTDEDGVVDAEDNCPEVANPEQEDADEDGIGDACDPDLIDTDEDGVVDAEDNCPETPNPEQEDTDEDGVGDACDEDEDDEEQDDACDTDNHPVAESIAYEYELDYETVIGWHCDGFGFGEIVIALMLAEETGEEVEDYLDMRTEDMGWGVIMQEAGVHPSELAGRGVGRGRPPFADSDDSEEDGEDADNGRGRGRGNGNGNPGGGPPDGNPGNGNPGGGNPGNGNPGGGPPSGKGPNK